MLGLAIAALNKGKVAVKRLVSVNVESIPQDSCILGAMVKISILFTLNALFMNPFSYILPEIDSTQYPLIPLTE